MLTPPLIWVVARVFLVSRCTIIYEWRIINKWYTEMCADSGMFRSRCVIKQKKKRVKRHDKPHLNILSVSFT